jgi:hypothetical protein
VPTTDGPPRDDLLSNAQSFVAQVFRVGSWRAELPPPTSFSLSGARAMSEFALDHASFKDNTKLDTRLRLFGPTDDDGLEALRRHSVGYLFASTVALGFTGRDIGDDVAAGLIHAAADPTPESILRRANLMRERLFEPPTPVIPEWLEEVDRFLERNCFTGVMQAVLEVARWARNSSISDSSGITSITPSPVCADGQLTLHGNFPATQPGDVVVYVPTIGGGCREAKVESWSDVAVVVRAPSDIGPGCAGFVKLSGTFREPQNVTGALTRCIGPAAEVWTRGFDRLLTAPVSCPPCLPNGQNRIQFAGEPIINKFEFVPAVFEPGGRTTLMWSVSNATSIELNRVMPFFPFPTPLPSAGSITFPPVTGLKPVTELYRLTARNGCGVKTRDAQFTMIRKPILSVTRIEVVQAIQKPDNSVRLVANRRTAVRVFVDSGINDGFDFGLGPNRIGGLEAGLVAENLATGAVFDCGAPWNKLLEAAPALNRDQLEDSINFDVPLAACEGNVRFRATVTQPGPPGAPPTAFASGSVDVTFTPKSQQMLLPFLITDPSSASPAPTMADFYACLIGPIEQHPFPDNGFIINPELSFTLSGAERLSIGENWAWLVLRLQTMSFLFASQPVGGVRMGIVPNDTTTFRYTGWGHGRGGLLPPAFIVIAGSSRWCLHELGHAAGLMHVNCGNAAGPYGGLPLTIDNPGLNVFTRQIFPSGSSEAMGYCGPPWPSILHWDHMFRSIPFA